MGVGLNTMLAAVGAGGVAESKIGSAIGQSQISEANDASKNEIMQQKALMNAERLKNLKLKNKGQELKNKNLRLQNRIEKQKLNDMKGGKK